MDNVDISEKLNYFLAEIGIVDEEIEDKIFKVITDKLESEV